jgi:hypothetical protein
MLSADMEDFGSMKPVAGVDSCGVVKGDDNAFVSLN